MCNAWNHSLRCRCGFGGEGHLGGHSTGSDYGPSDHSFFTLRPIQSMRDGRSFTSFVVPNAKCPVCRASVFFYQSPHGGRVFFDELGWPWPKHPCTDNNGWRNSTQPIEFVGADINHLALFFIHEWEKDGYFPLVCTDTKGISQIAADFLYETYKNGKKQNNHVYLYLKWSIKVAKNALFFIKEVDASAGQYELRFCYKGASSNKTLTRTVPARITTLIRPVLSDKKIVFQDFTDAGREILIREKKRLKVIKARERARTIRSDKSGRGGSGRNTNKPLGTKASLVPQIGAGRLDIVCEYCGDEFSSKGFAANHKKQCGQITEPCKYCAKPIPRNFLRIHQIAHCRVRNQQLRQKQNQG